MSTRRVRLGAMLGAMVVMSFLDMCSLAAQCPPFDPDCTAGISVTPDGAQTSPRYVNTGPFTQTFRLYNTGASATTVMLTCSSNLVTCSHPLSAIVPGGGEATVPVFYDVSDLAGNGSIVLTASWSNGSDQGRVTIPIVAPSLDVTPPNPATVATGTSDHEAVFVLQNTGSQSESYAFTCEPSGPLQCGTVTPGTYTIVPGPNPTTVTARYDAANGAGSGEVRLVATHTPTGMRTVTPVPVSVERYGVTVAPPTTSPPLVATSSGHVLDFTLTNTGTTPNTYTISCQGSTNIVWASSTCPGSSSASVGGGGGTAPIRVTFGTTTPMESSFVRLIATSGAGGVVSSDTAQVSFAVHAFGVTVAPVETGLTYRAGTGPHVAHFDVRNTGSTAVTFDLACTSPTACTMSQNTGDTLRLAALEQQRMTVAYSVGASNTTVRLSAIGNGADGAPQSQADGVIPVTVIPPNITVQAVPPTTQVVGVSSIGSADFDLANYSGLVDTVSVTCVASGPVSCTGGAPASVPLAAPPGSTARHTLDFATHGAPGSGSIVLAAASGGVAWSDTVTITVVRYAVAVSSEPAPAERFAQSNGLQHLFHITNTGTGANAYQLTCTTSPNATCYGPPSTGTVQPNDSVSVTVSYDTNAEGPGSVGLVAQGTAGGRDSASVSFPVNLYGVVVGTGSPTVERPAGTGGHTHGFTVNNPSSNVTVTYALNCVGGPRVVCDHPDLGARAVAPGGDSVVTVGYAVSDAGDGWLRLRVTSADGPGTVADSAQTTVSVVPSTVSVAVTSDSIAIAPKQQNTGPYVTTFTVTAMSGTPTGIFDFTCTAFGGVTCNGHPLSEAISGAASSTIRVEYSVTSGVSGTIALAAVNRSAPSDSAGAHVTIDVANFAVAVTPLDSVRGSRAAGGSYSETFTVRNTGTATTSYDLACTTTGQLTCPGIESQSPLALSPDSSAAVVVRYGTGVPSASGNTLTLTATSTDWTGAVAHGRYNVPVGQAGVAALPDGRRIGVRSDASHQFAFTVRNGTAGFAVFDLSVHCRSQTIASCSIDVLSLSLDPDETDSVVVDYDVAAASIGDTATVVLVAMQSGAPSVVDSAFVLVTVGTPRAPLVSVLQLELRRTLPAGGGKRPAA